MDKEESKRITEENTRVDIRGRRPQPDRNQRPGMPVVSRHTPLPRNTPVGRKDRAPRQDGQS